MSKESSPHGDTIENTYTDLGATTKEAFEISEKSRKLARATIGNTSPEDRIRQRCSVAVGDFSMADLIRFQSDPVQAGLAALAAGAPLITDIRMVQVGVQKKGHLSEVSCALDFDEGAKEEGITRTSKGFLNLGNKVNGAIIVIGNAPSALLTLCRMIRAGYVPVLVIGTPVGFVNAAESKEMLRTIDIPSISTDGSRGGTPVAVAAINEIITMYVEQQGRKKS